MCFDMLKYLRMDIAENFILEVGVISSLDSRNPFFVVVDNVSVSW